MRQTKTYISPGIKVRAIEMEDGLLAATFDGTLSIKGTASKQFLDDAIDNSDDIGAKSSNASDGWDDWEE